MNQTIIHGTLLDRGLTVFVLDRKKARHENSSKFIARVITDEIFLRLPFKSLFRFSSVSKSWNSSVLSNAWLADKYRGRKALVFVDRGGKNISSLALSNDRNQTGDDAVTTRLSKKFPTLVASCDTLLCAKVGDRSLILWNPWTGTYRNIHESSIPGMYFIRGLGYDAVADDYKILSVHYRSRELELYSLRSDSWRKIPPHHSCKFKSKNFVFVSRTFHWIHRRTIISFDLSTEKFGEVTGPNCPDPARTSLGLAACNGKLCVCAHNRRQSNHVSYVMWTMEDYGNAESWTKKFEISFDEAPIRAVTKNYYHLRYLHSYDDGRILIEASDKFAPREVLILVYKGNKIVPLSNVSHKIQNCFLVVESFVSPNMW